MSSQKFHKSDAEKEKLNEKTNKQTKQTINNIGKKGDNQHVF